ncbi:inositol monophosphatase family protein [Changpingibacter yushuensis]|uniref:inositol monophosphatase family protein n=1 Tax=Changpingibacter yushuensis TaxID=2758440 RepID=UPI0015F53B5C|nr:inositol monophosphatase [Changpingibacter yushuensis]
MYEAELNLARRALATYQRVYAETGSIAITRQKLPADFATESDEAIEAAVTEVLRESGIPIQGEEASAHESSSTRWIIDPIDGTFNFAMGIPLHGFILCLVSEDQPVLGVMNAAGEILETVAGQGTTLDGTRVQTSSSDVATGTVNVGDFTTASDSRYPNDLRSRMLHVLGTNTSGRIRMVGSAAVDLAWVAAGRSVASIIYSNHPWDTAAGVLAVRESGGVAYDLEGNSWSLGSTSTLTAASDAVADQIFALADLAFS